MANKNTDGKYVCSYCGKLYSHPQAADACRDGHALIYIGLTKEDLNRLLMFIQLKQDELMTESLWKALNKPRRI
jgi:hypothetical protein